MIVPLLQGRCAHTAWTASFAGGAARIGAAVLLALASACGSGGDDPDAPGSGAAQASTPSSGSSANAADGKAGGASGTAMQTAPIIASLNAARAVPRTCGATPYPAVGPLAANPTLEQTASAHTDWMQANDSMSHTGDGGSNPGTRLDAAGYAWSAVGENVAKGYSDAQSVIDAWIASAGHCANLMGANFTVVGYAMAAPTAGTPSFATLLFARPR